MVAIFDSDVFLIKPFCIEEFMEGFDLAAPAIYGGYAGARDQRGAEFYAYIRPQVTFMNMKTMPNRETIDFSEGYIDKLHFDTGAFTYHYFKANPDVKFRLLREQFDVMPVVAPWAFNNASYVADMEDPDEAHIPNSLYDIILRNQTISSWGAFTLKDEELESIVEEGDWRNRKMARDGDEESKKIRSAMLDLIRSKPADMQFYLDFAFLHYGRGSYDGGQPREYKSARIREFMDKILN